MSRPIIDSLKAIFVHVPKTGGVSIDRYLVANCNLTGFTGHHSVKVLKQKFPEAFDNYYKFAFVRNPWDRIVSAFFFLTQGGYSKIDKVIIEKYIAKYDGNFTKFILDLPNNLHFVHAPESIQEECADGLPFETSHFIEQSYWICDQSDNVAVDFIGRFESFEADFQRVCEALTIPYRELIKSNSSSHMPYQACYTPETAEIVARLYKSDIARFKYTF